MYQSTTVTCHECKHIGLYTVIEWPPLLTLCNKCGQVYKLIEHSDPERVNFHLMPYKFP